MESRRLDADHSRDLEWIKRIVQREHDAFGEFYDHYASRVLGLLFKILNNRSDAEEVLQETFWQVWGKADKFNEHRSSPRIWLFLMARSRAIDHIRRRPKTGEGTAELREPLCAGESEISDLETQESSAKIQNALAELPEDQAESIQLAFYHGLTHTEITQRLNVPLGTVKTRIRSGMQKLRTMLQDVSA